MDRSNFLTDFEKPFLDEGLRLNLFISHSSVDSSYILTKQTAAGALIRSQFYVIELLW